MTGYDSIGRHYRPRLLESLMPLLTLLITSNHTPEHHSPDTTHHDSHPSGPSLSAVDNKVDDDLHLKNLEIYVACLARLSEFTDYEGTLWCLWENAMQHPKLEQPLIASDKLVVLANPGHDFQVGLRSAASKVLNNYELDMEGNPVRSRDTVLWSVATVVRGTAMLMINVSRLNSQERGHPELHRPEDPATGTHVESARSSEEIKKVKLEPGDSGMC